MPTKKRKPVVRVMRPSYQPSKADLEADVQINANFQELTDAVVRDVTVVYIAPPPKRKKWCKK